MTISRIEKFASHLFMALGMLAVLLIVLWFVLGAASNLPVIGGVASWTAEHASGASIGA